MKRSGVVFCSLLFSTITLFFAATAQAQYRTSIQGVVTDSSGAVIPGATLTLTNPATGEKQVRTSNDSGVFNFNALPAARFRLEVEKQGFEKKAIENLELIPEQANAVNVQLNVGATSQTVNVDASAAPLLQTESASVSGVISDNQVQHMPSYGRDVLKLAQLAPGVFGDGSQGASGAGNDLPSAQTNGGSSGADDGIFKTENGAAISGNGQQQSMNGITVDGISTTSAVWGGSTVITPSEDSIDNFKIVSNSYDAENGRFSGAQLEITSKSGSNDYHGSLFFTAHRPGLNAYQPFNGVDNVDLRDTSRFNQMGGSVGGPILKNRLFAFFSYETIREHTNSIGNQWGDTAAFDALAPSGSIASELVNYPGNAILNSGITPSSCASIGLVEGTNCHQVSGGLNVGTPLNPALFPLGQIGPSPGFPSGGMDPSWTTSESDPGLGGDGSGGPENLGTVADIANYITNSPVTKTDVQYNGRVDWDVTGKDRIGFAIYWVPTSTDFLNGARVFQVFHHNQINDAFSPIWNHTFSPTFLNELRANAAGWRWNEITSNPQSPVGLPNVSLDYSVGSASIANWGPNVGSHLDQWTYSIKDVATKVLGPHTMKFGGELTRLFYLNACFGCAIPSYGVFNLWDFLNDAPRREGYVTFDPHTGAPTPARQDERENLWGVFFQDDYKVRPNLTINLGLRWSYFGALYSTENNMYVATPGPGSNFLTGLTVLPGNSWVPQKDNLSPEVGFAWSPSKFNSKMVVRGGYGLNYTQEQIAVSSSISGNPGLSIGEYVTIPSPTSANIGIQYGASSSPSNPFGYAPNPNFTLQFGSNGLPTGAGAGVGVDIFPHNLPTARIHHYSLDTQYDLGHNFVATVGYQGSLSRDLMFNQNPLAVPSSLGYTVNQNQINGGSYWSAAGKANYNSLLTELKHDFSKQFMADAQFTYAKNMDNISGPYSEPYYPYNPDMNYGRSDFNVGKAFKIFGMWQPVFFHGDNMWVEKIVGGWSLSGIFNIHSGFPWNPVVPVTGGSLYCADCGYTSLYPASYLGGAGHSTSNNAFKTPQNSNFPLVATQGNANAYFSTPSYTAYTCPTSTTCQYGTALPQTPGVEKNSLNLPGYKDLDLTLAKAFGFPNMRVLGENAKLEIRFDVYNVFNNLNLNPQGIVNNIGASNFGTITSINGQTGALASRTATLGARFSF